MVVPAARRRGGLTLFSALSLAGCGGQTDRDTSLPLANAGQASVDVASGGAIAMMSSGGVVSSSSGGVAVEPSEPYPDTAQGGASGAAPMRALSECRSPAPTGGGFVQCGDGSYRRPTTGTCESHLPRPERVDYQVDLDCWYDLDCDQHPHGVCSYGVCSYGCTADAECGDDELCSCGDLIGTCVSTNCRTDADCGAESACTSLRPNLGFGCFRPDGVCVNNGQCPLGYTCAGDGFGEDADAHGCVLNPG
jgi:hypothetical protein